LAEHSRERIEQSRRLIVAHGSSLERTYRGGGGKVGLPPRVFVIDEPWRRF
jgi:hypothetical protein